MGQKQKQDLRNIVLTMLVETMEKQGFSHILIQDAFSRYDLDPQEKAFVERLYREHWNRFCIWIIFLNRL